jgi:hypothetical protein
LLLTLGSALARDQIVDLVGEPSEDKSKPLISLTIGTRRARGPPVGADPLTPAGDPTLYGMRAPKIAAEALSEAACSGLYDGYAASAGLPSCRAAVAGYFSTRLPAAHALTAAEVFMTHGASGALSLALGAIANSGANVLLPRPGFPLYATLCEYYGIEPRYYELHAARGWTADCGALRALADNNTAALVVCNPGNPTGCVYGAEHLRALLAVARDIGAIIIADEVYAECANPLSARQMSGISTDSRRAQHRVGGRRALHADGVTQQRRACAQRGCRLQALPAAWLALRVAVGARPAEAAARRARAGGPTALDADDHRPHRVRAGGGAQAALLHPSRLA